MAKKITAAKPVVKEAFHDVDQIINKEFNDIVDISKIDTRVKVWYDWGVYAFNYTCSKNLFGGIPQGRVIGIESLPGCGKSLMCSSAMRDPKLDYVMIIETEGGGHAQELIEFAGVDKRKVRVMKANTFASYKVSKKNQKIEEIHDSELPQNKAKWETDSYVLKEGVTSKVRRFLYAIQFNKVKKRILLILDSLGNIQSVRGLSGTPDMGKRGQDFTNFFKNFDNEFERTSITFIFTNKMYSNIGNMYSPWASAGGNSPIYNSSLYIRLADTSETDDKSDTEMKAERERRKTALGSSIKTIRATVRKSRFGTEWRNVPFLLDFSVGPVRLSGLFTLLKDFNIIKKNGGSWYSLPEVWNKSFYKRDFIKMIMRDEKNIIHKFQDLLLNREEEIKKERSQIQVNDMEEIIDLEDGSEKNFGKVDKDEMRKEMIREMENS